MAFLFENLDVYRASFECVPLLDLCKRGKWLADNDHQRVRSPVNRDIQNALRLG